MRHQTIMQLILGVFTILFLILLWGEVKKLNPLITALTGAVNDNTAAVTAAVAALTSGGLSAADSQALTDATAKIVANTAALTNATPAAGAPNPPTV